MDKIRLGDIYPELVKDLIRSEEKTLLERVRNKKNSLLDNKIDSIVKNDKIFNFIEANQNSKKFYIWSNATSVRINQILYNYNYQSKFEGIISRDDVANKKPSLEGLLKIQETFLIDKVDMLIVDDNKQNIQVLNENGYSAVFPSFF